MPKVSQLFFLLFGILLCSAGRVVAQDKEPVQARVWSIDFVGNETYESLVLRNIIVNEPPGWFKKLAFWKNPGMKLNENDVKRDVIRIERFYHRRGFNDVKVSYQIKTLNKEWKKDLTFRIIENKPIKITEMNFEINSSEKNRTLILKDERFNAIRERLPYRTGQRYETINESDVTGNLTGTLNNLGFPYANSTVTANIDSVAKSAVVNINVNSGVRARFDSLTVEGEENLPAKYIIRETGIKKGSYFSNNQLREAQREVFSHHLLRFAIVSIPEQPEDSTINVHVRVREAPLRTVQLLFGVGNVTRIDNLWKDFYELFRGRVTWTHRNVRSRGERFNVSARASAIEQRLSTDYLFPYVFNTKSSLIFSPFIENKVEPSYKILRGGLSNSFVYRYSQKFTGSFSYDYYQNKESEINSNESLPDNFLTYNISSFGVNALYSDNIGRGEEGWAIQPFWRLSGLFGESTYSYQKIGITIRKFTGITDDITFAKRVQFSGIYYAKQDSLPSEVRVFSGGSNSVRGWNRQELGPKRAILDANGNFSRYIPTGGRSSFSFNTEFRFKLDQLIKGFGFATFLDGGQVWRNFSNTGKTPIQFGIGGGLRYQSPIGPVRIDLAYKINPTDQDLRIYNGQNFGSAWNKWGIHFSIGQAF